MSKKSEGIHAPTLLSRSKVEAFACAGYSQEKIASYLQIDAKTLRKHYREELECSVMDKIAGISGNAYGMAMEGNEKMIEFVLKTQGRWSYAKPIEEVSKDDKVISLLEQLNESVKKG